VSIRGFDHWAITVADIERTIAFYRGVLGCEILYEKLWRAGTIPIVSMRVGANVINVHQVGRSVYFRDPDGNLLELLSTVGG
jgi:catechol 2,3-dioxygenase-like lactoylglutathione lyase family enzyme